MGTEIYYMTQRSLHDCQDILQQHTRKLTDMIRFSFSPLPKGTVMARIHRARFRLFPQGARYVNNSFVPFFYGRLEPCGAGTRIVGQFQMHPFVRIFMTIWVGGLAVFTLVLLGEAIAGKLEPGVPAVLALEVPLAMFLFGLGLVKFGKWLGGGQYHNMEAFIRKELGAQRQEDRNPNTASHGTLASSRP